MSLSCLRIVVCPRQEPCAFVNQATNQAMREREEGQGGKNFDFLKLRRENGQTEAISAAADVAFRSSVGPAASLLLPPAPFVYICWTEAGSGSALKKGRKWSWPLSFEPEEAFKRRRKEGRRKEGRGPSCWLDVPF